MSDELRIADRIARKDKVPEKDYTDNRAEVADWIEEHAADEWSKWTYTRVADELGVSRQHVANAVRAFFVPIDPETGEKPLTNMNERELRIYRRGYRDGFRDGRKLDGG
jgi:hypothetical protein